MAVVADELLLVVRSNVTSALAGLEAVETKAKGLGPKVKAASAAAGKALLGVGIAAVGVGVTAGKLAMDFEKSMAQIEALVGVPKDEMALLEQAALDMGAQFGVSAEEAAGGLFFLKSAGLETSEAIETLAATAKASAIGLGEMEDLANTATTAMTNFGLTATEAFDDIAMAAKLAKADPADLGRIMNQNSASASLVGMSYEDMAATLALLTRKFGDARKAGTGMEGILRKLIKPSELAVDWIESIGLSAQDFQRILAEDLPGGLAQMDEAFKASGVTQSEWLGKVFEDGEAIKAAAAVIQTSGAEISDVFGGMAEAGGALESGWGVMEETAAIKWAKVKASISSALIPLGEIILTAAIPAMEKLGEWIRRGVEWFKDFAEGISSGHSMFGQLVEVLGNAFGLFKDIFDGLGPKVQGGIVKIAVLGTVLLAMVNPVTKIVTGLKGMAVGMLALGNSVPILAVRLAILEGSLAPIGAALATISIPAVAVAAALAAIGTAVYLGLKEAASYAEDVDDLTDAFNRLDGSVTPTVNDIFRGQFKPGIAFSDYSSLDNMNEAMEKLGMTSSEVETIIRGGLPAYNKWREAMAETVSPWDDDQAGAFRDMQDALGRSVRVYKEAYEASDSYKLAQEELHDSWSANLGSGIYEDAWNKAGKVVDANQGLHDSWDKGIERMGGWVQNTWHVNEAWGLMSEAALEGARVQAEILEDWREETAAKLSGVTGLFAGVPAQMDVSFGAWGDSLEAQNEAMQTWSDGIVTLMDAGMGRLAMTIFNAGPTSAAAVEALVNDMDAAFDFEQMLIKQAQLESILNAVVSGALAMAGPTLYQSMTDFGISMAEALAFGFTQGQLLNPLEFSGVATPGSVGGTGGVEGAFDKGGIVPGTKGAPKLILAHAGETVVPTHKPNWAGSLPDFQSKETQDSGPQTVIVQVGDEEFAKFVLDKSGLSGIRQARRVT